MKLCDRKECPEWSSLPSEVKAEVARLESAMQAIDAADSKLSKCKEVATNAGGMRGWSKSRLRSKYYQWIKCGRSWTVLVDGAKVGGSRETPRGMCDSLFKYYAGNHQRSSKKAHERMLSDIWNGKLLHGIGPKGEDGDWTDIFAACYPGMQVPSVCPFGWVPRGMSYRNMQHYARLTKREATALRGGMKMANKFTPPVFSTRVGMEPGMIYQFDDVWHDIEVLIPGINKGLARPLEFACVDYASTHKVAYGLICQIEKEDGSKCSLKERQMLWLVCHILTNVGYNKKGCVFVIEHGTATIRPKVRDIIYRMTDGLVTFRTSEIIGKSVHKGMFDGAGKGNFKAKALVESSHRLLHYEAAYLPAQTGGNSRIDRPEQLDGIASYANDIVKVWEKLPADQQRLLWMPALTFWAYRPIVAQLYRAIYGRTEHNMEGWQQNNWMVAEWSLTGMGDWQPVDNIKYMPKSMQAVAEAACKEDDHVRARRMSPQEVWNNGQDNLIRLPPWAVIEILGENYCHSAKVHDNGLIEFEDADIEPGKRFRFQSMVKTPAGDAFILQPGQEVKVYALPHDQTKAVLVDADGDVLGLVPAWNSVSPINAIQVDAAIEAQKKIVAAADAPIKGRHEGDANLLESMKASNDHLIEEAQIVSGPKSRKAIPEDTGADVDFTDFFKPSFNNNTKEGDPNEY